MRYSGKTIRIDVDTGELITKHKAETEYTFIKTTKETELNYNKTHTYVTWIRKYRTKRQLQLFNGTNT